MTIPHPNPQTSPLTHSLLSVVLVLIEAILALVLRLDARLRRVVYPLVKADTLVCIRTYLPHTQVYASFTYKGVLLDIDPPKGRMPDVIINAYSHELFLAVMGGSHDKIDALQMRGNGEHIRLIQIFLSHLGIGSVIETLIAKVRPKPVSNEQKAQKQQDEIANLKTTLAKTTQENQQLYSDNKRLATELAELQGKFKTAKIVLMVSMLITALALLSHLIW